MYSASLAQTDLPSAKAATKAAAECRDVVLARKPGWTLSGGFTPDGSQLLIVDSLYSTILRYGGSSGESLGPIEDPIKSRIAGQLPITGKPRGADFILEVTDGLMLMDKNLNPVGTRKIQPNSTNSNGWSVTGLWEWQPVGKTDIVAFVDIGHGPNPYDPKNAQTAFVRFPLQDPKQFKVLQMFDLSGTPNKGYFRSGYSYITSLGETAYYLSMNQGLSLYKQEKGKAPVNVSGLLPKDLDSPRLPDWNYIHEYVDLMKGITEKAMPVGLFGWQDSLYILYRSPQEGRTRWTLYNIDPSQKLPVSSVDLPISADHVTVVPGPKNWAFVEKGPVFSFGAQDIPRILFIPSHLLVRPLRTGSRLCQ
jgi:hypothetical protein